MGKVKAEMEKLFKTKHNPTVVCKYDRNVNTVTCISHGYAAPNAQYPGVLKTIPSLSILLNLHSQKLDSQKDMELLDITGANDGNCYIAMCGYSPTSSDFGMAYRNNVRFVFDLGQELGQELCFWVTQNTPDTPHKREELIQPAQAIGEEILKADWKAGGKEFALQPKDLYGFAWFKKFLTPDIENLRVPHWYEEEITKEAQAFGNFEASYRWSDHKAVKPDSEPQLWWTLIALYTNFAWGSQLPCYRSGMAQPEYKDEFTKKSVEVAKKRLDQYYDKYYGPFLDGLNVSGLLLDPTMKPVAWSVNTNKINKTQHAETALVLAWLQGNLQQTSFEGYTFISPWRPCCMCSAWIADVFKGCKVVWFIDDPGLPIRHLDWKTNGTEEIFLPSKIDNLKLEVVDRDYPWFKEFGAATHWDYNHQYLDTLTKFVDDKKMIGPVGLFKSSKYFERLTDSWESTRHLSGELLETLTKANQLESYVTNIWALSRCILAFDESAV
jgi:tRNA(Arg) A34 adenosine deaminase TadA